MQIRNAIVAGIAVGTLHDGDSLPSVRTLGAEIGVNLHTVNKAYKLLQSEGFIEILRNHGTVVHAGDAAKSAAQFLENTGSSLHAVVSEAITRGVDRTVLHKMIDNLYDEIGGKKK
jgi:DNA-binding transcriptional regulator YhcF (GntR family)